MRAYIAATEAYTAKDEAAYFAAFADPMICFYGKQDPRSALENARRRYFKSEAEGAGPLTTMAIEPVHVSPDEVLLVHWGIHRDGPGRKFAYPLFHRKLVVMAATDGDWRIAAEFSLGTSACYDGDLADIQAPRSNRACIRSMGKCMPSCCKVGESTNCEHCERQCAERYKACLAKLE